MSLDTAPWYRTALDNSTVFSNPSDPNAQIQSGFGWTARPFHLKLLGYIAMKELFIQTFNNDGVPGVQDVDQVLPPSTITSAPVPAASVYCTSSSPKDGDGLCTCNVGTLTFTTFTPDGGPGNSCQASTIIPPGGPAGNFGGVFSEVPNSVISQEQSAGVFTITQSTTTSTDAPVDGAGKFGGVAGEVPNTFASQTTTIAQPTDNSKVKRSSAEQIHKKHKKRSRIELERRKQLRKKRGFMKADE